jgi:protocatechuate 3,4-dioxygenase beta subunit
MSVAPPEFTPAPAPSCHDGDEATIPKIEGPFFKPRSTRRTDLRQPGVVGRPAELSDVVLTRACRPVAGALADLWHADAAGVCDNKGFRLRGHVFTDGGNRCPPQRWPDGRGVDLCSRGA